MGSASVGGVSRKAQDTRGRAWYEIGTIDAGVH